MTTTTNTTASIDLAQLDKLVTYQTPHGAMVRVEELHALARRSFTSGAPAEPVGWRYREYHSEEKEHSAVWQFTFDKEVMQIVQRRNAVIEPLYSAVVHDAAAPSAADYEEVLAGHRRLVRELDVALNGEAGAAKQASLCDIVSQVKAEGIRSAGAAAKTDHALPARRKPHSSEARDQAHAAGWNACLDAIEASATAAGAGSDQAQMLRDMLAIQEACGLHTDEYAPGSVIEYIKELEADATPAPSVTVQDKQRNPTEAMLNAARDWSVKKYGIGIGNDAAIGCWQAMYDAQQDAEQEPPHA